MHHSSSLEPLTTCRETLQDQLFLQTAAMFKYCFNNGIAINEELIDEFDRNFKGWIRYRETADAKEKSVAKDGDPPQADSPQAATEAVAAEAAISLSQVNAIHCQLAAKVAPALPASILLIESEMVKTTPFNYYLGLKFLGPIKLVRAMMGAAIVMLIAFIWLGCLPQVNAANLTVDIYALSGKDLLYNLLFLLTSAGIGASFAALFDIRPYIAARTYDTVYATDYWIRFTLGIISGLMLAELVPLDSVAEGSSMAKFSRPVLAMLGGFSVQVVYRVLQRFVQTLETLVQGGTTANNNTVKVKVREESNKEVLKMRTAFLAELSDVQKAVNQGENTDEVKEAVDKLFKKVGTIGA